MANYIDHYPQASGDMYFKFDDGSASFTGRFAVGVTSTGSPPSITGALRFPSISIAQGTSVNEAVLSMRADIRAGTSPVKSIIYGIDEDNAGGFNTVDNPDDRDKTSNTKTGQYDPSGSGWQRENVTSIVNEILARTGWSSGNAIAFLVKDNGTDTGNANYIDDPIGSGNLSTLSIRISAEPDYTPTPVTVGTSALPASQDYGLKIGKPGINVGTASETDLFFTSRKQALKVIAEAGTTSTGNITYSHSLGYKPLTLGYIDGNGYKFQMPRLFPGSSGTISSVKGYIQTTSSVVRMITNGTADPIYYYVFADELP